MYSILIHSDSEVVESHSVEIDNSSEETMYRSGSLCL